MMTLTQSSHLTGPSWDEEVVPALRKRLESESRTLARRMSAISLSSIEDPSNANYSAYADNSIRQRQLSPTLGPSQQPNGSGAQRQPAPDRTTTRVNGTAASKPSTKTDFQRARTYSSPNGHANGNGGPKPNTSKPTNPARSLSPRPVDIKPTRIPKASRAPISVPSSSTSSPYTNGYNSSATTPFSLSPELPSQTLPDQRGTQRGIIASSSTQTTVELSHRGNRTPGLLSESPPFPTDSTMSSGFTQPSNRNVSVDESPPRASTESEERPYEHWYRGEVSRNGGVGELRVGRRQEMLDIANYGHMIATRQAAKRLATMNEEQVESRPRKRAGSIAGITNKERQRGSLYLDEDTIVEDSRVLDEHPLTDLDGEGSEINSVSDAYGSGAYAYLPGVGDLSTPSTEWTTVAGAHESRSITPTPASMLPRPSSRQQQQSAIPPPTRIPGPSSRQSSESRSTVNSSPAIGGNTKQSSPPPAPSSSSNPRQPSHPSNSSPGSAQKRGASPASKKSRAAATKMTKSKTMPAKREDGVNRESVAYYPTPEGDGEDMADAIPSWTQAVPKAGNWDDVVLPVVARKKGLDGYYEEADGSPKPKKVDTTVAPAPGTFGFDGTKYRTPRGDFESIPMDEFGRAAQQDMTNPEPEEVLRGGMPSIHDNTQLPHRQQSPSPAPFSSYAPTSMQQTRPPHALAGMQQAQDEPQSKQKTQQKDDDAEAGCCKCVIM